MIRSKFEELLGNLELSGQLSIEQHGRSFVVQLTAPAGPPISLCRISAESYYQGMGHETLAKIIIDVFVIPTIKKLAEEIRQKQSMREKPTPLRLVTTDTQPEPVAGVDFDRIGD